MVSGCLHGPKGVCTKLKDRRNGCLLQIELCFFATSIILFLLMGLLLVLGVMFTNNHFMVNSQFGFENLRILTLVFLGIMFVFTLVIIYGGMKIVFNRKIQSSRLCVYGCFVLCFMAVPLLVESFQLILLDRLDRTGLRELCDL